MHDLRHYPAVMLKVPCSVATESSFSSGSKLTHQWRAVTLSKRLGNYQHFVTGTPNSPDQRRPPLVFYAVTNDPHELWDFALFEQWGHMEKEIQELKRCIEKHPEDWREKGSYVDSTLCDGNIRFIVYLTEAPVMTAVRYEKAVDEKVGGGGD